MKSWVVGVGLIGIGCTASPPSEQQLDGPTTLERLIRQHGRERVEVTPIARADGSHGFSRVRIAQRGLSEKFAITADGKYRTVGDAYALLMQDHRARYGSLSYDAAQRVRIEGLDADTTVEFVAWVGRQRLHDIALQLADTTPRVSTTPPLIRGRTTLRRIEELARHPDLHRIDLESPGSAPFLAGYANDGPGDYTRSVTNLAAAGSYGAGINVGILEGFLGRCMM